MFTVRVIPIAKGVFRDYLSFFSRAPVEAGAIVSVTVRGRPISGIVIESNDVRDEKMDLRGAGFSLQKIGKTQPKRIFTYPFIAAAKETAVWHGVSESTVLAALTSKVILSASAKLSPAPRIETLTDIKADFLLLQAERGERVRTYRNLARESFARNESTLIVAPTVIEAEMLTEELSRGIEGRVIVITGEISGKKLVSAWNEIAESETPLLVIGTPLSLSVPLRSLGTIVVERESARAYRALSRPHLDFRIAAQSLSRTTGARLILADFPLRVETRYQIDAGLADELARSQVRPTSSVIPKILDVRKKDAWKGEKRLFSALSPETMKSIERELARGGRVAVFAARRGLAPLTVCNDCGTPVTDPTTGTPMILHKTPNGTMFMSHRSGATLPSETSCKVCRGWNLVTLGIGVDRVNDELEKAFPKTDISLFTRDSAPTHRSAKKISESFYGQSASIVVGTERMLPYLGQPIETVAVASVDSLLSLSAWRAHEHALSILYYLRERSENEFIIETRKPDHEVMKAVESGNPLDFYRTDIAERKRYNYPPFSVFIGLSSRGTKQAVEKFGATVKELFSELDLVGPLPATQDSKSEWSARAVIRIERGKWPDAMLSKQLAMLPPDIVVEIDPDEIV